MLINLFNEKSFNNWQKGFLGNSLSKYLKKFYYVRHISFKQLNEIKTKLNRFNYIVNTSTNKSYIFKRYNEKFDNDLKIIKINKQ